MFVRVRPRVKIVRKTDFATYRTRGPRIFFAQMVVERKQESQMVVERRFISPIASVLIRAILKHGFPIVLEVSP